MCVCLHASSADGRQQHSKARALETRAELHNRLDIGDNSSVHNSSVTRFLTLNSYLARAQTMSAGGTCLDALLNSSLGVPEGTKICLHPGYSFSFPW